MLPVPPPNGENMDTPDDDAPTVATLLRTDRAALGITIRDHAELISEVVLRHARVDAEVLVTDPGRGNGERFSRLLANQGFAVETLRCPMDDADPPPHRGRMLHFRRRGRA
jgi:hypothetical protein